MQKFFTTLTTSTTNSSIPYFYKNVRLDNHYKNIYSLTADLCWKECSKEIGCIVITNFKPSYSFDSIEIGQILILKEPVLLRKY